MPLSPQTTERLRSLQRRAEEIMNALGVPSDEAWHMLTLDETQKVAAVAEQIERREQQRTQAEMRAKAAYSATYKSNLPED